MDNEPDQQELDDTSDYEDGESPCDSFDDESETAIKIRDCLRVETDSPPLLLSNTGETGVDINEDVTTPDELAKGLKGEGSEAEGSDEWESDQESDTYTVAELINTINYNNIALPDEPEVENSDIPGENNKDTSARGYEFVRTRLGLETNKIMDAFKETQWPLDLATGLRIDPKLKNANKSSICYDSDSVRKEGETEGVGEGEAGEERRDERHMKVEQKTTNIQQRSESVGGAAEA